MRPPCGGRWLGAVRPEAAARAEAGADPCRCALTSGALGLPGVAQRVEGVAQRDL